MARSVIVAATAWSLPLRGNAAFLARPRLWRHLLLPFLVTVVFTIVALAVLFAYALRPQAALLENWHSPNWLAWIVAVLLVLVEAAVLIIIFFQVVFGQVQGWVLREALHDRGVDKRVCELYGLQEFPDLGMRYGLRCCTLFLLARLPLMLVSLVLLPIPVVGYIAWPFLNGWLYAWELQSELLPVVGLRRCGQQFAHVLRRCCVYEGFGVIAMLLELIPFVNIIFFAGNAYGAALLFEKLLDDIFEEQASETKSSGSSASSSSAPQGAVVGGRQRQDIK